MQVRHKAFFHALKQNGLKSDPTCAGSSYYITQCMEKHLPRLLDMGITGIICSYDLIANAAMIQCQQLGYKVPDEISIIEMCIRDRSYRCQMSLLYSAIVLSEEKNPALAMFTSIFFSHAFSSS